MAFGRANSKSSVMGMSIRNWSLGLLTIQFSAFILLLHYSRVMPTPDGHRYLPSTAVFMVEVLKLVVCLTASIYELSLSLPKSTPATTLLGALGRIIVSGDSWKMAVPAGLYTLANSLQYAGISNLDAATFHVTYQFKIFVTALLSVVLLHKKITSRQWLSLLLLMAGVAIVSLPQESSISLVSSHHVRVYKARASNPLRDHFLLPGTGSHVKKRSATYEGIEEDELALHTPAMDASFGLTAVLAVCICSGLAGVYFEKVIKDSPKNTSLWIRNVQLSIYSLFPAFFIGIIFLDGETVSKFGFFAGYNWIVVLSIMVQSLGGIIAAFCIFYADNISKNFAISISMVLSSLASVLFLDFSATTNFLLGTSIVLIATWMYSTHEADQPQRPRIKLDEYEKSSNSSSLETDVIAIQIPKTPLTVEKPVLATSRPGSPAHKKRKNDQLGYFTKQHD